MEITKEEEAAIWQDVNAIRRDINDMKTTLDEVKTLLVNQQFQPADKLAKEVSERVEKEINKTPEEKKEEPTEPMDEGIVPDLVIKFGAGCLETDLNVTEAPDVIKSKKFLGDMWGEYNDYLRGRGYNWVRDGKNSHWGLGLQSQPAEKKDLSGFGKSSETVDTSEVDWLIKVDGQNVQARATDEKVWAFAMGYDRDKKQSTNQPKKSTEALVNYLDSHEYYCDGEYKYTISKDRAFLSRELLPN